MIGSGHSAGAVAGFRVGIVDERSEIAACSQGVPQNELGPRADVIDGCPKAAGIMVMIRSMSPDVVVTDEVGRREDASALEEAARCGVAVIATAHALDPEDAARRPVLRDVLAQGASTERWCSEDRSAWARERVASTVRPGPGCSSVQA